MRFSYMMESLTLIPTNVCRQRFSIRRNYRHRLKVPYFNDTPFEDATQDDVYALARDLAEKHTYQTVLDVGCGSGFKLRKYFSNRQFVGADVEATVEWLRREYPGDRWVVSNFDMPPTESFDLVIASDVIEHVDDPDELMGFLGRLDFKHIVLSTPDRGTVIQFHGGLHGGPPKNPYHLREWSFDEFETYVSHHFQVLDHRPASQTGQMIVATKKAA